MERDEGPKLCLDKTALRLQLHRRVVAAPNDFVTLVPDAYIQYEEDVRMEALSAERALFWRPNEGTVWLELWSFDSVPVPIRTLTLWDETNLRAVFPLDSDFFFAVGSKHVYVVPYESPFGGTRRGFEEMNIDHITPETIFAVCSSHRSVYLATSTSHSFWTIVVTPTFDIHGWQQWRGNSFSLTSIACSDDLLVGSDVYGNLWRISASPDHLLSAKYSVSPMKVVGDLCFEKRQDQILLWATVREGYSGRERVAIDARQLLRSDRRTISVSFSQSSFFLKDDMDLTADDIPLIDLHERSFEDRCTLECVPRFEDWCTLECVPLLEFLTCERRLMKAKTQQRLFLSLPSSSYKMVCFRLWRASDSLVNRCVLELAARRDEWPVVSSVCPPDLWKTIRDVSRALLGRLLPREKK